MFLRRAGHCDSSIRGLECNNTLKLCGVTLYLRWPVNEVCICWRVHVWDHVFRCTLSLLKPPDVDGQATHFCHYEFPSPACAHPHPLPPPPLRTLSSTRMSKCMTRLHAFFFFLFQIKFLVAESIMLHSCSYLRDTSHITGIAFGLHSHVGTNQRCNISTSMAFQQNTLLLAASMIRGSFAFWLALFVHGRDQLWSG